MANWFYYDNNGQKQGPYTGGQLKHLVKTGTITPVTIIETETGEQRKARKIIGLFPENTADSHAELQSAMLSVSPTSPVPVPSAAAVHSGDTCFCTQCGGSVRVNAFACLSCGADPQEHSKFCKYCGRPTADYQITCIKCGRIIKSKKSKFIAGILALFFGGFGLHWFYLGNRKRGEIRFYCYVGGFMLLPVAVIPMLPLWVIGGVEIVVMYGVMAAIFCVGCVLYAVIAAIWDAFTLFTMSEEDFAKTDWKR
jgi:TM2 domain-containing membrane protein YozV